MKKQRENIASATDMFWFIFVLFCVVKIFTTTQCLHFRASCSSKKTKVEKTKVKSMQSWNRQGFFISETGRLCDEENQERNTADSSLDFISKCTSTLTDAFIPLCQWELNYGGVLKYFVIAIWERYIYVTPLSKNIFVLFLYSHTHTSTFWWTAQIPAQFSSALGLATLPTLVVGTYYWGKQVRRAGHCKVYRKAGGKK